MSDMYLFKHITKKNIIKMVFLRREIINEQQQSCMQNLFQESDSSSACFGASHHNQEQLCAGIFIPKRGSNHPTIYQFQEI